MVNANERPEEDLVAAARGGDDEALAELVERCSGRLLARLNARLKGGLHRKVAASDILQEAHLVASRRIDSFEDRGRGSFDRWLGKIVDLKLREAVRRFAGSEKRGLDREITGGRLPAADLAGRGPTPSQVAMGQELKEQARDALTRLSDDQRQVVELLQEKRLTATEAAEVMGKSEAAVKRLYGRALARLEELLGLVPEDGVGRRRPTR
jgi:RNA polymerase sigma-70 factor (ECF subfamily)